MKIARPFIFERDNFIAIMVDKSIAAVDYNHP